LNGQIRLFEADCEKSAQVFGTLVILPSIQETMLILKAEFDLLAAKPTYIYLDYRAERS
jgi:hypothetical protein